MPVIGFIVSLLIGIIVSFATKGNKESQIDRNLINLRVCRFLEKVLPQNWRQLQNDSQLNQMSRNPINKKVKINAICVDSVRNKYVEEDESEEQSTVPVLSQPFKTMPERTSNI